MTLWRDLTLQAKRDAVRGRLEHPTDPQTYKATAEALGTTIGAIAHLVAESGKDPNGKIRSLRKQVYPRSNVVRLKPVAAKPPADALDVPLDTRPAYERAWRPLPGSKPVALEHHTTGCRWPVEFKGEADRFCNEMRTTERYCATHHAMGVKPEPPRTVKVRPPAFKR